LRRAHRESPNGADGRVRPSGCGRSSPSGRCHSNCRSGSSRLSCRLSQGAADIRGSVLASSIRVVDEPGSRVLALSRHHESRRAKCVLRLDWADGAPRSGSSETPRHAASAAPNAAIRPPIDWARTARPVRFRRAIRSTRGSVSQRLRGRFMERRRTSAIDQETSSCMGNSVTTPTVMTEGHKSLCGTLSAVS